MEIAALECIDEALDDGGFFVRNVGVVCALAFAPDEIRHGHGSGRC